MLKLISTFRVEVEKQKKKKSIEEKIGWKMCVEKWKKLLAKDLNVYMNDSILMETQTKL